MALLAVKDIPQVGPPQWGWINRPDAVIQLPFNSFDISRILAGPEGDPEWLRAVRRNKVREAVLTRNWLDRIRMVFDVLGLVPTEETRLARNGLAKSFRGHPRTLFEGIPPVA